MLLILWKRIFNSSEINAFSAPTQAALSAVSHTGD